ncbi:hypothetical protein [Streptomyces sp. enrichment culture]|uniref:hypothetical protein n=1 Tax=Streptomyces sp. enrichment culture TaxID=1795815 RepID=UPI003F57C1BF
MWAAGEVADCTVGNTRLHHPTVGAVRVTYQVWLQLTAPTTASRSALGRLGWTDALRILTHQHHADAEAPSGWPPPRPVHVRP